MRLILLGAPGAGKGTIAKKMASRWDIPQISTGDILRRSVKAGTDLGKKALSYMQAGDLVPDGLVLGLVEERLKEEDCRTGYIFDGFPRTLVQADGLEELLNTLNQKVDAVIQIEVPYDEIKRRILGRRTCSNCQEIYNIHFNSPKQENICDKCDGKLIQRDDETEEVIETRLKVYEEKTAPLIDYYKKKGLLKVYNGMDSQSIFDLIVQEMTKLFS